MFKRRFDAMDKPTREAGRLEQNEKIPYDRLISNVKENDDVAGHYPDRDGDGDVGDGDLMLITMIRIKVTNVQMTKLSSQNCYFFKNDRILCCI